MEILNQAINLIQMGFTAYGMYILIQGAVNYGNGIKTNNPSEKDQGGSQIMGGGIILAAATILVPILRTAIRF